MKTIYLHGSLAEQFGESFTAAVKGPAEAIKLLEANFPGRFVNAIKEKWFRVRVVKGDQSDEIVHDEVFLMQSGAEEIHFEPIIAGGIKGLFGLFFGLPLIGQAFAPLGLSLGGAGAAAGVGAFGGIGQILLGITVLGVIYLISSALAPKTASEKAKDDEKPSFLFDGPVNVTEQGGPVPLVYGEIRTGSTVVAGGIQVEQLSV
jgi:predicted phage tail protein